MTEVTQQAQLDEPERRHLEKIVKQLRERAEETVEYWVHSKLNLAEEGAEAPANLSAEERELRGRVEEAIEREQAGERSWAKARDLYVKGVGYTLVNRLAALRCMEVRGFLDRSPTRFRDDGVTPAADRLITDYFLPREAGIWTAFLVACQKRSEEIEILFDLSDPYSLLYGDLTGWDGEPEEVAWSDDLQSSLVDLLQDLGGLLDEVEDAVWRADDVLGWVYEYYNVPDLEEVRSNVKTKEDAIAANQFYTPHWVVRMLVDNSLGKLYLEHDGSLEEAIAHQEKRFTPEERKARAPSMDESPSVADLCSYLVPTEEEGEPTDALDEEGPKGLRVFDPASGSGHFLLYAFDVLERIWRAETDVDHGEIPEKILKHNLYGVDLDLRACQLAAFNLYLKARSRAAEEGNADFQMPNLGIVCADVHVADLNHSREVFREVAGDDAELLEALGSILNSFEHIDGLGSLLDVKGTLQELIDENDQLDVFESQNTGWLSKVLDRLHETASEHLDKGSFRGRDIKKFLRLLVILSSKYDVYVMNPPYGSRKRMPNKIRKYIKNNYKHVPQYYISFFEVAEKLTKKGGRVGMLVPRPFMFKKTYEEFRRHLFTGSDYSLDLLTELGIGVLDNATVRTVGSVLRKDVLHSSNKEATFLRLHDVETKNKEQEFINTVHGKKDKKQVTRLYRRELSDFGMIPGYPISYWVPKDIRSLFESEVVLDAENGRLDKKSLGKVKIGVQTGNDERFIRYLWEGKEEGWIPFTSGGKNAWVMPKANKRINWIEDGREIKRHKGSRPQNTEFYGKEGLTFTHLKESGRRFGLMKKGTIFNQTGPVFFPSRKLFYALGFCNSKIFTYLMLAQATGRHWSVGKISKIPWRENISKETSLHKNVKKIIEIKTERRSFNFDSPYYKSGTLLRIYGYTPNISLYSNHEHNSENYQDNTVSLSHVSNSRSIESSFADAKNYLRELNKKMYELDKKVNEKLYDFMNISESNKEKIKEEIFLRTNESEEEITSGDPTKDNLNTDLKHAVKKTLLHIVIENIKEDDDGIVLLRAESDEEEADLLSKIIAKFDEIWGEHAEDRLQEVDEVLGNREPTDEPYPNLRHWLENDLFAFHCDEFENTPILWELTTERLGEDNGGDAGFACLIDYHQLGPDIFDRLSARYLETRKAALRERQQSARRTAEGSEGTQAREARQEEKRCENALRQIDELETRISELTQSQPRDWAEAVRDEAQDLQPKVRRFRERLEKRLETLDALHEEAPSSWFKDHFSDKFMESVGSNRDEWIDALEDLEAACEQFARPADEPVEAHLYDLLPYFDDLTGSTHYSSNGVFFLNYYFSKGKDLAAKIDQGSKDRVTRREQLVADLARETDDDIELGEEINEACQAMKKHMESDWKPRALEEVRTPGYRPVKKHGVAINITPLAEKKLVPELVDKKVL